MTGAAVDPGALLTPESYYYQVRCDSESNPSLYDLNAPRPAPFISTLAPSEGHPGDQVAIDGANFPMDGSGLIVTFGALPANVVSVTPTQIVVDVPAGTVTGDVRVCVSGLCSNTILFTVPIGTEFRSISSLAFEPGTGSLWVGDRGASDDIVEIDGMAIATIRSSSEIELTAPDAATSDHFGRTVAIDGDTVAIASRYFASGRVYVYTLQGAVWTLQDTLVPNDGVSGDWFGESVTISGDTIVVGAPVHDEARGAAYVFVRNASTWSQEAKLTAGDADPVDAFGARVAIDGNTAVVGAVGDSEAASGAGAAYVFTRSGTTWTEREKLIASASANDGLGCGVSISGGTIVIGAGGDETGGANSGAAYVYTGSGAVWTEQQKLKADIPVAGSIFGGAVSVDGNTLIVGAFSGANGGSAYAFARADDTWTQSLRLSNSTSLEPCRWKW